MVAELCSFHNEDFYCRSADICTGKTFLVLLVEGWLNYGCQELTLCFLFTCLVFHPKHLFLVSARLTIPELAFYCTFLNYRRSLSTTDRNWDASFSLFPRTTPIDPTRVNPRDNRYNPIAPQVSKVSSNIIQSLGTSV